MTRKRIYIAGPISKGDLCANVNAGTAAFVALAKAGFAPWCPQWSVFSAEPCEECIGSTEDRQMVRAVGTAIGAPSMTHADWMGIDLPWVAVSDAVLRLPGESVGADLEVACAKHHGVPVFESVEAVVAWALGARA